MSYYYDQRVLFYSHGEWNEGRYQNVLARTNTHRVNTTDGLRIIAGKDLKPFTSPVIANYKAGEDIEYLHSAGEWLTGTYHKPSPNGTHHKIWRVSGMSDSFHYSHLRTPQSTETKEPTNKNVKCTSCGTTDRECYENRNFDKFNGACCWTCHAHATHGQDEPGHLPIHQAIKESIMNITSKSTKSDIFAAYTKAQAKLDDLLPLIRRFDDDYSLHMCEDGIQEFCEEAGIEYTPPVKEMNINLSVTFVDTAQLNKYGDSLSEEAIKEITTKIDKILEAAGVSANVNYEDSYE